MLHWLQTMWVTLIGLSVICEKARVEVGLGRNCAE